MNDDNKWERRGGQEVKPHAPPPRRVAVPMKPPKLSQPEATRRAERAEARIAELEAELDLARFRALAQSPQEEPE